MKKTLIFTTELSILFLLVLLVSCSKDNSQAESSDTQTVSKVFTPEELLSANEASEISGFKVTLDEGTLMKDPQTGIISLRYKYDINESNTSHALVQIEENGFKPADKINKGFTAAKSFESEMSFSKNEITPVSNIGDKAFTFNHNGQLHMLYKDYYIIVAFDADPYSTDKNAPLNIKLGQRILANLMEKL
jgi:hypothetical protein